MPKRITPSQVLVADAPALHATLKEVEEFHAECCRDGETDSVEAWRLLESLYEALRGEALPEIPEGDQ